MDRTPCPAPAAGRPEDASHVKWLASNGFEPGLIAFWLGLDRRWVGMVIRKRVMRRVPPNRPRLSAYRFPPDWVRFAQVA